MKLLQRTAVPLKLMLQDGIMISDCCCQLEADHEGSIFCQHEISTPTTQSAHLCTQSRTCVCAVPGAGADLTQASASWTDRVNQKRTRVLANTQRLCSCVLELVLRSDDGVWAAAYCRAPLIARRDEEQHMAMFKYMHFVFCRLYEFAAYRLASSTPKHALLY
jgi:hypothetical protein